MNQISAILSHNIVQVIPDTGKLEKLLSSGKKLSIYHGIDPSGSILHLGHAITLKKLRQFQDLGHQIILLIGDFTGMIGDPTDKTNARSKLSHKQVLENAKTYKQQVAKILKFDGKNPAELKFNSSWLSKMTIAQWIEIAANLTIGQLEERSMFVERKASGKPIFLHEFIYPVLQGYDSVVMAVDIEIGGTDQTFNMLVGRDLEKLMLGKEKFVLTVPLLLGTDGQKMGKSLANYIPLTASPYDMYGKIMSIPDELIKHYFELITDIDPESIDITKPMEAKKQLAFEVVRIYHGLDRAKIAQNQFQSTVQQKQTPSNLPTTTIAQGVTIVEILQTTNLVSSASEAKRLVGQGAVCQSTNGKIYQKITDPKYIPGKDFILKKGSLEYHKIKITK